MEEHFLARPTTSKVGTELTKVGTELEKDAKVRVVCLQNI